LAAEWWCTTSFVYLRTSTNLEEEPFHSLRKGRAVLAKRSKKRDKWVELVVKGSPKLYMLTYAQGMPELKEPTLMKPVEAVGEILSSRETIHVPWSVDLLMGGGEEADEEGLEAVKRLATEAIFGEGRKEVLQVEEVAGSHQEDHRTFEVQRRDGERFIMHCDTPRIFRRLTKPLPPILIKSRFMDAIKLFSSADLAPPLLAEGQGWHLEAHGRPRAEAEWEPEEVGELLAEIHNLPTAWYTKYQPLIREQLPCLAGVGNASHVWRHTGTNHPAFSPTGLKDDWSEASLRDWINESGFEPHTAAACSLVTCHGNPSPKTFDRTSSGRPRCTDLRYACVTFAVEDVSRALHKFVEAPLQDKEVQRGGIENSRLKAKLWSYKVKKINLVKAYLKGRGLPAGYRDADDFLFDADCYRLVDLKRWGRRHLSEISELRRVIQVIREDGGSELATKLRTLITCHNNPDTARRYLRKHQDDVSLGAQLSLRRPFGRGRSEEASAGRQHRSRTLPPKHYFLGDGSMEAHRNTEQHRRSASLDEPRGEDISRSRSPKAMSWAELEDLKPLTMVLSGETTLLDVGWGPALEHFLTFESQPTRWREALQAALEMKPNQFMKVRRTLHGRVWIVVGGPVGIRVRKFENLNSRELSAKLIRGTIIEETELRGDRLHYRRLRGEGPDYGWVSIRTSQHELLMPLFPPDIFPSPPAGQMAGTA